MRIIAGLEAYATCLYLCHPGRLVRFSLCESILFVCDRLFQINPQARRNNLRRAHSVTSNNPMSIINHFSSHNS